MSMHHRVFVWLTRMLPHDFDDSDRAAMQAMFLERATAARSRGRPALLRFAIREYASILRICIAQRAAIQSPDARGPLSMNVLTELRHAARRLARTPSFTAAAVLTLAIAIGANTAIFTLLYRVVLAPLPFTASERLVALDHTAPGVKLESGIGITRGLYEEYAKLPSVESIAMYVVGSETLSTDGDPEDLPALWATPSLADVIGARPEIGRWFTPEEGLINHRDVIILNDALWRRRFGADRNAIGRTVRIGGVPFTIIGVMARGFAFPHDKPAFILPLVLDPSNKELGGFNFKGVARMREGATVDALRTEANRVIADLPARYPNDAKLTAAFADARLAAIPLPLKDLLLGNIEHTFWILLAAVGGVLLIACANLANLFLVRAEARQRDVAVRRALGAGSRSIIAYFLSETVLVAFAGGILGLGLAYIAIKLLILNGPIALPRLHEVHLDSVGVLFALCVSVVAGLAVGLMPIVGTRPSMSAALQDSGRGNTAGVGRMHARRTLMAAQLALATVLLVGAALMLQSYRRLSAVDPGFKADSRLTFTIGLSQDSYKEREDAAAFQEKLLQRLNALPGVKGTALITRLPLTGDAFGDPISVRGRPNGGKVDAVAQFRRVSTSLFDVLQIPLLTGRAFDERDMLGHSNAVIVDQALADVYFPGGDAIGSSIRSFGNDGDEWLTIIGIAGNTLTFGLDEKTPTPHMYMPLRSNADDGTPSLHNASYVLKTTGDPLAIVPFVRRALADLDPMIAMSQPEAVSDIIERSGARTGFTMILLMLAALVSLALGLVGVYAVISYAVSQRTNEIGVRLALGARPQQVSAMIVRESGPAIVAGVMIGTAAAVAGARTLRALLFGVAWNNTPTYLAVIGLLVSISLAACWLPARRAARISPLESLR